MPTPVAMLTTLLEGLPCAIGPAEISLVPRSLLPLPFARMLDHDGHMTAAVEARHGVPVGVRVLQRRQAGANYAREILLVRPDGAVVQYAVVSLDLACCPPAARAAILAEHTPLGHILQRLPGALRIEPVAFVRAPLPACLAMHFGVPVGHEAFGRLVRIHLGADCLIEGLELLANG